MKTSIIKIFFIIATLSVNKQLFAGQDTTIAKHKWWIPKNAILQHGGSIGFLSAGIGYHTNKSKTSTLDFMYGYVPVSKGGDLHIFTAKFTWRPINIKLNERITFQPVNPGVFLTYHSGKNFDSKWDGNNYPKGYYWWSTAIRPHISLSNEIKFDTHKTKNHLPFRAVSLYNEFNTNELYLISYLQNTYTLRLKDIFKLGFGARIYL